MANYNKMYKVKNRSASMAVYSIPELGIRREFAPGEEKKISYNELEKLSYLSGGRQLMTHFLQITDEEVTTNLNIHTENEYYMSEEQIIDLIKYGSIDAFLDCLDYAPIGIIDLIKRYAVDIPMNDANKREALKKKTGFDVDSALKNKEAEKTDETQEAKPEVKATTGRRTTTNYKVVTPKETEAETK